VAVVGGVARIVEPEVKEAT